MVRETSSDEELARAGAPGLDALFRRHQDGLERYCRRMLREPADAADAAQSAWLKAHLALASEQTAVLAVRPWLYAIARNECLDRIRSRHESRSIDMDDVDVAGGVAPDETHEHRAELDALLSDLAGLSDRQRSAIVLRELAGMEADELADALETTPTRALGLVADARRVLLERRSGRQLPCEMARGELGRVRRRSGRLSAHLESCAPCQSFESNRRGRLLSSAGFAPLALLHRLAERFAAFAGPAAEAPAALKAGAAAMIVTGVAGLGGGAVTLPGGDDRAQRDGADAALHASASASAVEAPVVISSAPAPERAAAKPERGAATPRAVAGPPVASSTPDTSRALQGAREETLAPAAAPARPEDSEGVAGPAPSAGPAALDEVERIVRRPLDDVEAAVRRPLATVSTAAERLVRSLAPRS